MEDEMIVLKGIRSNTRCLACAQILDAEKTNCQAGDSCENLLKSSENTVASRLDYISLVSILLTCVADNNERNTNNLDEFHGNRTFDSEDLFHICQTCEKNLVEFDKLSKEVSLLNQRLRTLKYTVIAKFISAAENQDGKNAGENLRLTLTCSKLEKIRKSVRTEFIPNVMLENLSPSQIVSVQMSTEWDAVNGEFSKHESDENNFPSDASCGPETQNSNFHGRNSKLSGSVRKKKTYLKCEQVGPNEFLYAAKYKISFDGFKYSCGLCSSSLLKKDTMVTHIRRIHMRDKKCNQNVMLEKPSQLLSVPVSKKRDAVNENVTEHKSDDDYCPSDVSSGPEAQNNNFCDSNSKSTRRNPKNKRKIKRSSGKKIRGILRCVPVGPNEFLYAEKYKITFNGAKYSCGLCPYVSPKKDHVLTHIRRRHMRDKKVTPNVVLENLSPSQLVSVREKKEPSEKKFILYQKCKQVGPNEFLYAEKFKISFDGVKYSCGECSSSFFKRATMVSHMRRNHLRGKMKARPLPKSKHHPLVAVKDNPNKFLHRRKYEVDLIPETGAYKCILCGLEQESAMGVTEHIDRLHYIVDKRNSSKETSTKLTAPNEFLYNGKYPFKYLPAQQTYSCGLCEYQNDNLHCMYPHIRTNHYTLQDKQEFTAVQVSENEYLYMGKYPIFFKDGKYTCGICNCKRFNLQELYGHIKSRHTDAEADKLNPKVVHSEADVSVGVTNDIKHDFKCKGIPYSYDGLSRKFTCGVCSARVTHRTSMLAHIRTFHTGLPQQYICEVCGDSYRGERSLRKHRSRHGPPKYTCQHCGKLFRSVKNFKSHVAVHELGDEAKKFQCEYCGKRFIEKKHVNTHVRTHTGEKPYKCDLCDEMFADTAKVSYHKKTVHGIAPKKKFY